MTNTQSYAGKTGSNSGGLAIEATLRPPGADPRQRDGGSDTFRTWSVRRGMGEFPGRDPFEGQAARKADSAGWSSAKPASGTASAWAARWLLRWKRCATAILAPVPRARGGSPAVWIPVRL